MKRITKFALAGALSALVLVTLTSAGLLTGVVSAQAPTPGATTTGSSLNQLFWDFFAKRLGITTDAAQEAYQGAMQDTVDQALQDQLLTQEQADRYQQRIDGWSADQGGPFGHGGPGGPGGRHGGLGFGGTAVMDAAAKTLGMTTDELRTALQSGQTLADVAGEKNVSVDTLKQAMITAAKAEVDAAVTAGTITQAQADEIKARIDEKAATLDLSQPFFGGPGHHHGGPRFLPFGGQPDQTVPPTTAPSNDS